MLSLEWRDVSDEVVRLRPENSKNEEPREIHFNLFPELGEIISRVRAQRRIESRSVFYRDGRPLCDFSSSWTNACTTGVPEAIAMSITGHKTRSVFERYNIVSQSDTQTAVQNLATYLNEQPTAPTVFQMLPSDLQRKSRSSALTIVRRSNLIESN